MTASSTMLRYALVVVIAALASPALKAQGGPPNGTQQQAPPAQQAPAAPYAGGFAQAAPAPRAATSGGPTSLYGLRPVADPPVLALDEVLAAVAESSFDLRAGEERLYQQQLNVQRAWTLLMPQLSAGGSYTYSFPEQEVSLFDPEQSAQQALLFRSIADVTEKSAALGADPVEKAAALEQAEALRRAADDLENADVEPIVIQPAHQLGAQLSASLSLFNGRSIPLIQNAYDGVEVAKLSTQQARGALMLAATQAYYGGVAAKKLLGIAKKQEANAREHQGNVQQRVELGAATPLSLQRAEIDVVRAEQQARVAENAYQAALGALGLLMDRETMFEVVEPPPPPAIELEAGVEQLTARALEGRDDLAVQRVALRIAERQKLDAWMQFLPTLSLSLQGRYGSNTSGFTSNPFTGAVVLGVNVPLFDGGSRYVSLRESDSKIREEMLKLEQARRAVQSQVLGNLAEIAVKRIALETARRALELSKAQHESAKQLFELGAATSLDVIDASLAEYFAEVEATRAELDLAQARVGLSYVLGELTPAPDKTPRPFSDDDAAKARSGG